MPSFDVVSKTDLMEVDNAVNGVKRQIRQRFDLAGTKCDVQRNENSLTITADDNMKLTQLHDLLRQNFASRKVDAKALDNAQIAGAGLDVFGLEPMPSDHPLITSNRTVITPHIGYVTQETYKIFYEHTVECIAAFINGKPVRVLS